MKPMRVTILGLAFLALGGLSAGAGEAIDETVRTEVRNQLIDLQRRKVEAEELVRQGDKLISLKQYADARVAFEQALALDRDNAQARQKLEDVRRFLPSDVLGAKDLVEADVQVGRIQEDMHHVESRAYYSQAEQAYQDAERLVTETASEEDLSKALEHLREAEDAIARTWIKIKSLPTRVDSTEIRNETVELEKKIQSLAARAQVRRQNVVLKQALDVRQREIARVDEMDAYKINTLLTLANKHVERKQFNEARLTVQEIIKIDPVNQEAQALQALIRDTEFEYRRTQLNEKAVEERLSVLEQIAQDAVPAVRQLEYPANWSELRDRVQARSQSDVGSAEEWRIAIQKKLQEPISFNFTETPLPAVLRWLSDYKGININDFSGVAQTGGGEGGGEFGGGEAGGSDSIPPVTLQVKGMRLENALRWIMESTKLTYKIENEAINITRVKDAKGELVTRVYDVADIASAVKDARSIDVTTEGDNADDDEDTTEDAGEEIKLEKIIEQLSPTFQGGSEALVRQVGNTLVVVQTEDVHKLIEQTLSQLRAAQAIQVAVTARFLTLRDDFWEQFSSSFGDFSNSLNRSNYNGQHTSTYNGTWSNNPMSGIISIMGSNIGSTSDGSSGLSATIMQTGWLGDIQSQWFLKMLKESSRADELFAPHLIVYNNARAWIQIDTRVPYISGYEAVDDTYNPNVSYTAEGTRLQIRPTVSSDKRFITVNIEANVSKLIAMGSAVQRATTTTPATTVDGVATEAVTELPIDLPTTFVHQTQTYATMPDGGSILISGLAINVNLRGRTGVPLASDLPVVGNMFSNRIQQKEKRNFAIMVNARMYLLEEEEARLSR